MQLKIVTKNENHYKRSSEEIEFIFFENIIKKDLELANWSNNAIKVFGNFQIFADYNSELDSFDQIINFIMKNDNVFYDETNESYLSVICTDYFLNLLMSKEQKFTSLELDNLASRLTTLLLEVTSLLKQHNNISKEQIKSLADLSMSKIS